MKTSASPTLMRPNSPGWACRCGRATGHVIRAFLRANRAGIVSASNTIPTGGEGGEPGCAVRQEPDSWATSGHEVPDAPVKAAATTVLPERGPDGFVMPVRESSRDLPAGTRAMRTCPTKGLLIGLGCVSLACCGLLAAQDFPLVRGSYLSTAPGQAIGVAIAIDGSIVVGTNRSIGDGNPDNDSGLIELRRPDSNEVVAQWPLDAPLRSLRQGNVAGPAWVAATATEVLVSNSAGSSLADRWMPAGLAGPARVAVSCGGGQIAVLAGNQVGLYAVSGTPLQHFSVAATAVNDLACSAEPTRIYLTGYRQASANLQVAFVEAFDSTGARLWRNWGWSAAEAQAQNLGSDTRGQVLRRVDNTLYFAGSSAGGVPVYLRDPQNLASPANNLGFDAFNQTFNLGGPSIGYYANLDPENGTLRRGQFLLTRLNSGQGNSVSVLDMAIDGMGRVHLGGRAFASMANRGSQQVAGLPVAAYSGGDPHLLVVPESFNSRAHWTSFIGENGRGSVVAIANRGARLAFLIESNQGSLLTPAGNIGAGELDFTPSGSQPAAWLGLWGETAFLEGRFFHDGFER